MGYLWERFYPKAKPDPCALLAVSGVSSCPVSDPPLPTVSLSVPPLDCESSSLAPAEADAFPTVDLGPGQFSVLTFNINAPIHKRLDADHREADFQALYLPRNQRIVQRLLASAPTLICLQEFWVLDAALREMYVGPLVHAGYDVLVTPRPNGRGDGLLTAVARDAFDVLSVRNVQFNDCGDRVAQLLHLRPTAQGDGDLLLVNTHLMFPHNVNSTGVRLRQVAKLLAAVRAYMTESELEAVPIAVCGDWNGTANGRAARLMRSQGFVAVYDKCHERDPHQRWVSHLDHRRHASPVDCVWLLNPSAQTGALSADWRPATCAAITAQLLAEGIHTPSEAFAYFDRDGAGRLSLTAFAEGVVRLGLTGPGSLGLVGQEVKEVAMYCDRDGDGFIGPSDLHSALDLTAGRRALSTTVPSQALPDFLADSSAATCPIPAASHPGDLNIVAAALPPEFAAGTWPMGYEDRISDHAPLIAAFALPSATPTAL